MAFICELYQQAQAQAVVPEFELFDLGHVTSLRRLLDRYGLPAGGKVHVDFVMGVPGAMPGTTPALVAAVAALPAQVTSWSATGVGRTTLPVALAALSMGGHLRVGMEDVLTLSRGVPVERNAQLVERAVALARQARSSGQLPLEDICERSWAPPIDRSTSAATAGLDHPKTRPTVGLPRVNDQHPRNSLRGRDPRDQMCLDSTRHQTTRASAMGRFIMKKLIVGLLAAFLMAGSLVAFSGSSAQAACTRYGGCPATQTSLSGPAVKNRGATITFISAVSVVGSNAAPRGTVRVVVKGVGRRTSGTAFTQRKSAKRVNQYTFGRRLKPGKYTAQAIFKSNGSLNDSSSVPIGFKVRNRR